MKNISKSTYVSYKTCPKSLWLQLYKEEEYVADPDAAKHIEEGKEVGALAKGYFKDTVDATSTKPDGSLDIKVMIEKTQHYIAESRETIAEASFSKGGLFCSVDLLHKAEDGYEIYEVKATTDVDKEHLVDAAFQKYALTKFGLKIVRTYILHLNKEYRRKGDLDLQQLFVAKLVDSKPLFLQTLDEIKGDIEAIKDLLDSKTEPEATLLSRCEKCPFKAYCQKDVPSPSVFDINGLHKYKCYNKGIVTLEELLSSDTKLNRRQRVQIDATLNGKTTIVDKAELKAYLSQIRYPVYHLDFESYMMPIPPADDIWPYEQVPTQYSLHIEYADGRLEHKEFLGDSLDPRREIAESLCRDIPADACVTAFNKTFECGRLKELASLFPDDLGDHLLSISDNIVDLIDPFKSGIYYHKDMGGSNSIKDVLPALYPNDPELDYHALPVVHNGGEAMDIYPKMLKESKEEQERIREGLLVYCCLDTLAMVKVLRKLQEAK